jgi:hypothetical protein
MSDRAWFCDCILIWKIHLATICFWKDRIGSHLPWSQQRWGKAQLQGRSEIKPCYEWQALILRLHIDLARLRLSWQDWIGRHLPRSQQQGIRPYQICQFLVFLLKRIGNPESFNGVKICFQACLGDFLI